LSKGSNATGVLEGEGRTITEEDDRRGRDSVFGNIMSSPLKASKNRRRGLVLE